MDDYVHRIAQTLNSMDPTIPPSYDGASAPPGLPPYSRRASVAPARRVSTEHQYHLTTSKGSRWATLKVSSRSPTPTHIPTFLEGDKISGSFTLNLDSGESITCVRAVTSSSEALSFRTHVSPALTLVRRRLVPVLYVHDEHSRSILNKASLLTLAVDRVPYGTFLISLTNPLCQAKGQIIPGPTDAEAFTFAEAASTLWFKDAGDPRNAASTSRYSGKLSGHYEWPFTLDMPGTVTLPATNQYASGTFRLPQTFLERRFPTSVQYVLIVHINRSRFRLNSRVQTMFAYVPATRPPPPSLLRQLAYQENSPLLGPDADPAGWEQLPPFTIRGVVFSTRPVEAVCNFSLAKPLCYTRGSPIPCVITLSSTDTQALDLLSSPRAISVHLRRRLRPVMPASKRSGIFDANADLSADPAEDMAAAAWWPSPVGAQDDTPMPCGDGTARTVRRRTLDGEIQLSKILKPSCRMAHFAVEYTVEVLPFKAIAFASADSNPLLRQRVEVVTMFANNCPRPRTYAPPQYQVAEQGTRDNYFNADGLGHVWRT